MFEKLKFWESKNKSSSPDIDASLESYVNDPAAWLVQAMGGRSTASGEKVTAKTATQLDAVVASIKNISEDVAKLPLNIFEKVPNGKKLVTDHFAQTLLHDFANPEMSSMAFFETLLSFALGEGNGLGEIVRDRSGRAVEMWPIHPSRATPFYRNGDLWWRIRGSSSGIQGDDGRSDEHVEIPDEDMFNLRGLSGDGVIGFAMFVLLAESIGQGLATQNHASSYYGNATAFSGALVADQALDEKQYKRMRKSWAKKFTGGARKQHGLAILEAGLKFQKMSSDASEAQLIESQNFTVERMARIWRIPPHKIGHNTSGAGGNLEAQDVSYFRDTLTPWIARIKLEIKRKILKDPKYTASHEVNALTLGDSKTRAEVFKKYMNMGVVGINDVRRFEAMNVIEEDWADKHYMQMNITTAENISEGANLKPKGAGQMAAPKSESGVSTDSNSKPVEIDMAAKFDECKKAHLPSFTYAAKRIVLKESKSLERKLEQYMGDETGFTASVEKFYEKQKADVVDVFTPCCQVFMNTFGVEGVELNMDFLSEFSDLHAQDGISRAKQFWNAQSKGFRSAISIETEQLKIANSVINMIGMGAKGVQNEIK